MSSAREAIRADNSYVKGHAHLAKALSQLGQATEAGNAIEAGMSAVQGDSEKVCCCGHVASSDPPCSAAWCTLLRLWHSIMSLDLHLNF